MKIKELKEFINRHELDDDTEICISANQEVFMELEFNVVTKLNNNPIKHQLMVSHVKVTTPTEISPEAEQN